MNFDDLDEDCTKSVFIFMIDMYDGAEKHVMKISSVELRWCRDCGSVPTMSSAGDVEHAVQVTLGNVPDPVSEQRAVKVLTGLRCSVTLNPYLCPCR